MLRVIPPIRRPAWRQRIILRLAASRPVSWLLSRSLERLDKLCLSLSGGRITLTTILTGLPVIQVRTRATLSGQIRVCPLIPLPDRDKLVVFGTNFGSQRDPGWSRNMTANPEVVVAYGGRQSEYLARPADESERARYWRQAVEMYPGYKEYARRAAGRQIPIMVLEPNGEGGAGAKANMI